MSEFTVKSRQKVDDQLLERFWSAHTMDTLLFHELTG